MASQIQNTTLVYAKMLLLHNAVHNLNISLNLFSINIIITIKKCLQINKFMKIVIFLNQTFLMSI